MSRGSYPLVLTMALSAPGASHALGLGEIHVDSKLNQPLSAHIDIIGASDAELATLSAAIADRDAFQRFGLDRPAFLNSARFSVARDRQHRPVLGVRSSESFTEPVIDFVIELRWPNGALVREYTLLLDPAGADGSSVPETINVGAADIAPAAVPAMPAAEASADAQVAAVAPAAQSRAVKPAAAADVTSPAGTYSVRPRDTLHAIARRLGARSQTDARRMMMVLFELNPQSFDGNINRLHRGAELRIPTAKQLAQGSTQDIEREFRAQMRTWRLAGRPEGAATLAATPASSQAATAPPAADEPSQIDALNQRIESLQRSVIEVQQQIERDDARLHELRRRTQAAARGTPHAPMTGAMQPATNIVAHIAAGGGIATLLLGALVFWRFRRRQPDHPGSGAPSVAATGDDTHVEPALNLTVSAASPATAAPASPQAQAPQTAAPYTAAPATPAVPAERRSDPRPISSIARDLEETIVIESSLEDAVVDTESTAKLKQDEHLAELEITAQHVLIEGELNSGPRSAPFVERRRSVVDILRAAIDKEPHRRELKMKLLELYYSTAAANRASFLEVAKMMARDRDMLASSEWEQVMAMGRALMPNEKLFPMDAGEQPGEASNLAESAA